MSHKLAWKAAISRAHDAALICIMSQRPPQGQLGELDGFSLEREGF